MVNFYTKKEWSKLFSDILTVGKKCNYFPRPGYKNPKEFRTLIMNAYKESMYFAKAYPTNEISNRLLAGFVSYADNFRIAKDIYPQDFNDFKTFLTTLYNSLNPFFEKHDLLDEDWDTIIESITNANNLYKEKHGDCNPLFVCIGFTLLDIFELREKEALDA